MDADSNAGLPMVPQAGLWVVGSLASEIPAAVRKTVGP
jgi:hypothetical protein